MKRLTGLLGTVLVLLLLAFNTGFASAAATSSGLSITPRKDLNINPGQTVTDKLTIGNLNNTADLQISFKLIDFTFMDQSGTPKLLLGADNPTTAWSLKPFMTLPDSVVVPAGQSKTVQYSVKIPAGQGAGSYYGAIQYGTGGANGGNVNLSASGVTLVFVSVPGVVHEDMQLKKFGAYAMQKDNVTGQYIYIALEKPKELAYTLQNNGNVAEAPQGDISVKYMFGKLFGIDGWNIDNANPNANLALRGQTRLFTACLENQTQTTELGGSVTKTKLCKTPAKMWPGRYVATLDTFYGQNGNNTHEINSVTSFWYLPLWFLACVFALLVIIGIVVTLIIRKIRKAVRGPRYGTRR